MRKEIVRDSSNDHVRDMLRIEHISNGHVINNDNDNDNKNLEYRKILKELGIGKPEWEPLTDEDLRAIFIYMQESMFVGS